MAKNENQNELWSGQSGVQEDPVVRTSRREAVVTIVIFLGALSWTVGYCTTHAYGGSLSDLKFEFGIPQWVLRGIVAPWAVCTALSWWMSAWFMDTSELEAAAPPPTDDESEPAASGKES